MSKSDNSNLFPTPQAHKLSGRGKAQAQIEKLWATMADQPGQRALVCAAYCLEHAPHLVEWLKTKILAGLSDRDLLALTRSPVTDGRVMAYNQLCEFQPQPAVEEPVPNRKAPAPKPQPVSFHASYEAIFGVTPTVVPDLPAELRAEPEIGRVCIGLDKASEYRIYIIARALTRSADGSGKVTKKALRAALARYRIEYTRRHFNRLLKAGEGIFWNLSRPSIYVRSYSYLCIQLIALDPDLFATNRPGVRDVYLSPEGSLEQWEGMLYAGWLTHRNNPTISRATLETLFHRSADTLRRWEATRLHNIVIVRANDVQCPHPLHEPSEGHYSPYIPEHSTPYIANIKRQDRWQQVVRIRWRTSNSYHVKTVNEHSKRGQSRKVRKAVNETLDNPADEKRGGAQPFKRYFDNAKHLKNYTAKHNTVGYLWRGEARWGRGIFEINDTGFWLTYANERVNPGLEQRLLR